MSFEDVQEELKGRTTFKEPVVTREVLINALKSSAYELSVVKADYYSTKKDVSKLKKDNAKLKEEMVEMPTTASPLFLIGLAGGAFMALDGLLSGLRRRFA